VKRAYVPKDEGGASRPIGRPTFEDKVLQRAVTMILEAVYEQDFLDCSLRLSSGPVGTSRAGGTVGAGDADARGLADQSRHAKLLGSHILMPPSSTHDTQLAAR